MFGIQIYTTEHLVSFTERASAPDSPLGAIDHEGYLLDLSMVLIGHFLGREWGRLTLTM